MRCATSPSRVQSSVGPGPTARRTACGRTPAGARGALAVTAGVSMTAGASDRGVRALSSHRAYVARWSVATRRVLGWMIGACNSPHSVLGRLPTCVAA
eukprot:820177-Alexandrium_andersonii.AAC.1